MLLFHYGASAFIMLPIDTIISTTIYCSTDYERPPCQSASVCYAFTSKPWLISRVYRFRAACVHEQGVLPGLLALDYPALKSLLCFLPCNIIPLVRSLQGTVGWEHQGKVGTLGASPVSPRGVIQPLASHPTSLWLVFPNQLSFLPYLPPGASKS